MKARITWNAGSAPNGIRNMAKNRAPVDLVLITRTLPMAAMSIGITMWNVRSFVREECSVTASDATNVANQIGTVNLYSPVYQHEMDLLPFLCI